MFGIGKVSELDRLRAVYADQSDGELLRLHEERDGLTDAAKEALAEIMKQRGLAESAAEAHSAVSTSVQPAEQQGDSSDALSSEEVPIYTFGDTYQLRDMIRLLEESNIPFRLQGQSDFHWAGLRSNRQTGVTVIVEHSREKEAAAFVRQVLFTSKLDAENPPELAFTPPSDLALLLTCGRADALGLVHALSDAGISFYWRDGRKDEEVPGEEIIALEVHTAQRERADQAVQAWMSASADSAANEDAAAEA